MNPVAIGYTPLHLAVLSQYENENDDNIKALLDQGASPAARTSQGDTPLHLTIGTPSYMEQIGDAILIDDRLFLLEENPFGSHGLSHCHIACLFGNLEIVRSFLDRGVDPNLHRIRSSYTRRRYHGLRYDETCLHLATYAGRSDVVLLLLERGADPNVRNSLMCTPLHNPKYDRHGSATKLLVEHGADVNARNGDRMTPLRVQCSKFWELDVVKALIEAGADVSVNNLPDPCRFPFFHHEIVLKRKRDDCVWYMFKHVISLQEAGFDLSNENLTSILWFEICDDMTEYRKVCRSELECMNQVHLDARTTLRDALHVHDSRRLQRLSGNEEFERIVADEAALGRFAVYGHLARLQYRRGARIAEAVLALQKLYACIAKADNGLPPECAEIIVYYLPNEDRRRMIQAVSR